MYEFYSFQNDAKSGALSYFLSFTPVSGHKNNFKILISTLEALLNHHTPAFIPNTHRFAHFDFDYKRRSPKR